jgi:inorganic pyrophosphatase
VGRAQVQKETGHADGRDRGGEKSASRGQCDCYGFIPHTLSEDGDPCDVLVVNTRAVTPGAMMSVRPVGVLFMEDEAGHDEKIIAVPASRLTRRYDAVKTYADLPEITIEQVQHFFEHYKDLEPKKWVKVTRWGGVEEAHRVIQEACARAKA